MPINEAEFQIRGVRDPHLAVHASSALPVWLWANDGTRILWANPAGAAVFGARNSTALAARTFGPADQHRRQVARLAGGLALNGTARLERLRGFGMSLGLLLTCACTRLVFTGGGIGVLVSALTSVGRVIPYNERVQRLIDDIDAPVAAFTSEGRLLAANSAAAPLLTTVQTEAVADLSALSLDQARQAALRDGRADATISIGHTLLQRVGQGADVALLAFVTPPTQTPAGSAPDPIEKPEAAAANPVPWDVQTLDDVELSAVAIPNAPAEAPPHKIPLAAHTAEAPDAAPIMEAVIAAPADSAAPTPPAVPEHATDTLAHEAPPHQESTPHSDERAVHHDDNPAVDVAASPDVAPTAHMLTEPPGAGAPSAAPVDIEHTLAAPASEVRPAQQEIVPPSPAHHENSLALDSTSAPDIAPALHTLAERLTEFTAATITASTDHTADVQSSERAAPTEPVSAVAPDPPVDAPADRTPTPEATDPIASSDHPRDATTTTPLSLLDDTSAATRRHPLRFMWQMDEDGRFALGSDEFSRLIGPRTATGFGRLWSEIAVVFNLDPDGLVAAAIATRDTWSGITVNWPADGAGGRLPVELSGLPIYDRTRNFLGYRGFGVCRDLEALAHLAAQRRHDALHPAPPLRETQAMTQDTHKGTTTPDAMDNADPETPQDPVHTATDALPSSLPTQTDHPVDSPKNVVPFRPVTDLKTPTLTPVENNAFNELARQLASRLETERLELDARDKATVISPELFASATDDANPVAPDHASTSAAATAPDSERLASPRIHTPPQANSRRDTLLYDRMPLGILVYRLDRLLYANKAFLDRVGYSDLQALAAAGGLDALYVEPGADGGGSTSDEGTPVQIAATGRGDAPTEARLHGVSWDGDAAHALIFSAPRAAPAGPAGASSAPPTAAIPAAPIEIDTRAEELGTILDATDDGILIFDAEGRVLTCNRGAEIMFGYDDRDIVQHNLIGLFAPDSHNALNDDLAGLKAGRAPQRREVKGRARSGDTLALALTIGRTTATGERFFAVCRNLASLRTEDAQKAEPPKPDLDAASAKRQADRAANARADILARISHEVRTPLNSIIGFADVMIEERFGALGNERYVAYMKDIRAAGERVLAIISDLLDLSRAETGKLDLTFTRHDLNDMVEKCVTIMQPQANRERIIIRTSLAHALPPVMADAGALRQIVLNLVGNSIHVARAGGQVIVSTALTDLGDVVLRIRDTGRGLNHSEMEAALEQFRNPAADQLAQDNVGINLSLTRALVEANQAQFHIKSAPQSGTLVEIAFTPKAAQAV